MILSVIAFINALLFFALVDSRKQQSLSGLSPGASLMFSIILIG